MSLKRYWIRLSLLSNKIILDLSAEDKDNEILIPDYRISEEQGLMLHGRTELYDPLQYADVMLECKRLFSICDNCGHVTNRSEINRTWEGRCEACFRDDQKEKKRLWERTRDRSVALNKRILLLSRHYETKQGKIDAVPAVVIYSNIRYYMYAKGLKYMDLAKTFGVEQPKINRLLSNRFIKAEDLQVIADFIEEDIEKLLYTPKGYKIEYLYGVPAFWFESRLRYMNHNPVTVAD